MPDEDPNTPTQIPRRTADALIAGFGRMEEKMIATADKVDGLTEQIASGTASQLRMADIMEERHRMDREKREAQRVAEAAELDRRAAADANKWKALGTGWEWFTENWRVLLGVPTVVILLVLQVVTPAEVRQMVGLSPPAAQPVAVHAAPVPVPTNPPTAQPEPAAAPPAVEEEAP